METHLPTIIWQRLCWFTAVIGNIRLTMINPQIWGCSISQANPYQNYHVGWEAIRCSEALSPNCSEGPSANHHCNILQLHNDYLPLLPTIVTIVIVSMVYYHTIILVIYIYCNITHGFLVDEPLAGHDHGSAPTWIRKGNGAATGEPLMLYKTDMNIYPLVI